MAKNASTKKVKLRRMQGVKTREQRVEEKRTHPIARAQVDDTEFVAMPKDKYSIMMDPALARRVRAAARHMGISFNAYVSAACAIATSQGIFGLSSPTPVSASAPAPAAADPWARTAVVINQKAPESQEQKLEKKLARYGPVYVGLAEGDEPRPTITWDKLEAYVRYHKKHPDAQWYDIGRALGLTSEEARAADQGESDHKYEQYMNDKYGEYRAEDYR